MSRRTWMSALADWLENEAEALMSGVVGRRASARTMRGASAADLKEGRRIAEMMAGRKLPRTSPEQAEENSVRDERIADKLEKQARQLSEWADRLRVEARP